MGDIVLQTSLFAWLKLNFSDCRITLITSSEFAGLVNPHGFIDNVISYKKKKGFADISGLKSLAREIEGDFLIDLHNTLRSKLLRLFCFKIPVIKVFKRNFARFLLINFKINLLKNLESHHIRLIEDFAFLFQSDFEREDLEEFILASSKNQKVTLTTNSVSFKADINVDIKTPYIIISPVASFKTKLWPIKSYLELTQKILNDQNYSNYHLVVLGGPNDLACKQFDSIESSRVTNLQGKTTFLESSEVISKASFTITNDTGVAHLSESFGIPVLSFFGPTSPDFGFRPHLNTSQVLYKNVKCSPCSATGSKPCKMPSLICMEEISVDEAFYALKQIKESL